MMPGNKGQVSCQASRQGLHSMQQDAAAHIMTEAPQPSFASGSLRNHSFKDTSKPPATARMMVSNRFPHKKVSTADTTMILIESGTQAKKTHKQIAGGHLHNQLFKDTSKSPATVGMTTNLQFTSTIGHSPCPSVHCLNRPSLVDCVRVSRVLRGANTARI